MSEVREDAEIKAERLGLNLIKPGPTEVFVDLDGFCERGEFDKRFLLLLKCWPQARVRFTKSPSGRPGRFHAYVTIPELCLIKKHERIALQAALGSDPFREILAIYHGRAGYQHTSVFFETPTVKIRGTRTLETVVTK